MRAILLDQPVRDADDAAKSKIRDRTMPTAIEVELVSHDPSWAVAANMYAEVLRIALGPILRTVHHIGSTAVPGLKAKPILDLIPVVAGLKALDRRRSKLESLGFEWWGEYGLAGRRYLTWNDPGGGPRRVQLHCFVAGSSEIERHLVFRDVLRKKPDIAHAYERDKLRCRDLYPHDSHAYSDCKSKWIRDVEAAALAEVDGKILDSGTR